MVRGFKDKYFWFKGKYFEDFVGDLKGQLISKCLFGAIVWTKKNNDFFSRISALASKKRSNQKSSVRESK